MSDNPRGLCELRLGNFKAFAEVQRIPIRPLTLIYGANSSGKSSILHSLLFASQAVQNGNVDVHQTKIGGAALDLGGFTQYVHKHELTRRFVWGLEFEHAQVERVVAHLGGFMRTAIRFEIGRSQTHALSNTPRIMAVELHMNDSEFTRLECQDDGRQYCVRLNFEHPALSAALDRLIDRETTDISFLLRENPSADDLARCKKKTAEAKAKLLQELDAIKQSVFQEFAKVPFTTSHFLPISQAPDGEEYDFGYDTPHADPDMIMDNIESAGIQGIAQRLRYELECLFRAVSAAISKRLNNINYLGPTRYYPPRHLVAMEDHDPNWFSGGGQAWELLRRNPEVLSSINQWLTAPDRLAKGYELRIRDLADLQHIAQELRAGLEDSLGTLLAQPNASVTEQVDRVLKRLSASKLPGTFSELIFQDLKSQTEVSHRDIGQGVSQVLPVLVHAYASENGLIAVEQPELHLHPALQAELADVFIESALGTRRNKFMLETHSEHLLLRLMRRMRETHGHTLPPGKLPIRPEDVAVLYVETVGSRSIVREMPLNERGELIKDWPGGFFEEGLREVLI